MSKPRYSGDASRGFWQRVNRLPQPLRMNLYSMGLILQDTESRVLVALGRAEDHARAQKKGARR